jgi:hypothetical protein
MVINAMEHLVSKQEFDLLWLQHFDEAAVVVEVPAVSGSGSTPFICVYQLEPGGQIAKETGPEQHAHSGSDQEFTHFTIQFGVHGPDEIGEPFGVVFVGGICCGCGH